MKTALLHKIFSIQAKDDYQGKHTYWAIFPSVSWNAAAVVTKFTSRAICSIFTGCIGTIIYTEKEIYAKQNKN